MLCAAAPCALPLRAVQRRAVARTRSAQACALTRTTALAARHAGLGSAAPLLCAARARPRSRRCAGLPVAASAVAASPAPEAASPLSEEEVSGALGLACAAGGAAALAPARVPGVPCLTPRVLAGLAGALATARALGFYCVTVALSLPLFVSMMLITPFELAFDKYRRAALHFVNDLWAVCSTGLFYRVEVRLRAACCQRALTASAPPAAARRGEPAKVQRGGGVRGEPPELPGHLLALPPAPPVQGARQRPAGRGPALNARAAACAVHLQDQQLPHPHYRLVDVPDWPRAAQAHGPPQPDGARWPCARYPSLPRLMRRPCAGVLEQMPRAAAPEHAGAVLPRGAALCACRRL